LYFFFGHWIVCTLFCTFSLVIGLSVLYFVLFLWSLDCLYFIFYFFFSHWIVCTLFCTFSFVIGLPLLRFTASDYNIGIFKRFLEIIPQLLTHSSKTFIFVLSVHKLTIHCQEKMAEEITQIASMTPLKEIRIYEAK
jgi:hypothetical protein